MKKILTYAFSLMLVPFLAFSQADKIKTGKGDLTITPITHGTVAFQWNNLTVFVDPYGGAGLFKGLPAPDLVLITDIHGDHLNQESLDELDLSKAKIVVPQAVADQIAEKNKSQLVIIGNGQSTDQMGINIKAIPMYNLPESADSRHTKGRGNGYIVNFGGKNVYLSGDTSDIPEMRNLKGIDVAFVCMNLPYTMDVDAAASAVIDFKPVIVYPYHYRGLGGLNDVDKFKELVNKGASKVDVRLRQWYPAQ
jgi:L-ascorbate metabolism protein UlaG (beta-lactamase superfamily)